MRKSADRQRKRQSRAAAPKHPADPPRDLGSEPPRWSSSSRAPVLPRSTACSGSTLDRPSSYCNDGTTSTDLHSDLVSGTAYCGSKQIPSSGWPTTRQGPRALLIVGGIAANASADILNRSGQSFICKRRGSSRARGGNQLR